MIKELKKCKKEGGIKKRCDEEIAALQYLISLEDDLVEILEEEIKYLKNKLLCVQSENNYLTGKIEGMKSLMEKTLKSRGTRQDHI